MRRGIIGFGVCVLVVGACSASGDGENSRPGSGGSSASAGSGADGGVAASSGSGGSGATAGSGTTGGTGGSSGSGIAVDGSGGTGGLGANPGTGGGSGGCGANVPTDQPVDEQCGDGLDNNLNGFVDEACPPCNLGQTQACFGGYPSQATAANCHKGTQTCTGTPEFHSWGPCQGWSCDDLPPQDEICVDSATGSTSGNGVDDDCDGLTDEGCALNVPVFFDGDCVKAACPQQAPYPIGCNITLEGGDSRGCVSTAPGGGQVYFQEGDACCIPIIPTDCGNVTGTLLCSTVQGPPLNATNCPINKQQAIYPASGGSPKYGCP